MGQNQGKETENLSNQKPRQSLKASQKQEALRRRTRASIAVNLHLFHRLDLKAIKKKNNFLKKIYTLESDSLKRTTHKFIFNLKEEKNSKNFCLLIDSVDSYNFGEIIEFLSYKRTTGEIHPNFSSRTFKTNQKLNSMNKLDAIRMTTFKNKEEFERFSDYLINEHFALKTLESSNFKYAVKVKNYKIIQEENEIFLFQTFELFDFSLKDLILFKSKMKSPFKEEELLVLMKHLFKILFELKSEHSISHGDIKLTNFLYDSESKTFKLNDFISSTYFPEEEKQLLEITGTPFYFNNTLFEGYSKKNTEIFYNPFDSDLYAFGLTCLFLKKLTIPEQILTKENLEKEIILIKSDQSQSGVIINNILQGEETYLSIFSKFSKIKEAIDFNSIAPKVIEIRNQLNEEKEIKADIHFQIGFLQFRLGQYDFSMENLRKANEIYSEVKDNSRKAKVCFIQSIIYDKLNMPENMEKELEPCLPFVKKNFYNSNIQVIKALSILGNAKCSLKKYVDAIMYYEESLTLIEKEGGMWDKRGAIVNEKLGDIYEQLNQQEEAVRKWNEAFSIFKNIFKGDEENEECQRLHQKIVKYHPSEEYDDMLSSVQSDQKMITSQSDLKEESPISPFKSKDSILINGQKFSDFLIEKKSSFLAPPSPSSSKKKKSVTFEESILKSKFDPNRSNLSNDRKKSIEFYRKAEVNNNNDDEEEEEEKEDSEKNYPKKISCELDVYFEKKLASSSTLYENKSTRKNILSYIQSESDFKNSNFNIAEYNSIFKNECLSIKYKILENYRNDSDLVLDMIIENISFYEISNMTIELENSKLDDGVVISTNKFLPQSIKPKDNLNTKFNFQFIKYITPGRIVTVSGNLMDKILSLQFRLPCFLTLFSKNLDRHDLAQFKKALELINEERKYFMESANFALNQNYRDIRSLKKVFPFFEFEDNDKNSEGIIELSVKENTVRFLLKIKEKIDFKDMVNFEVIFVCFEMEKFNEEKNLILNYIKTLIFLLKNN